MNWRDIFEELRRIFARTPQFRTQIIGPAPATRKMWKYLESHPPRCLTEFRSFPTKLVGATYDGHGEELNIAWGASCTCGDKSMAIRGYRWQNMDYTGQPVVFIGPITLVCGKCNKETLLFDASKHGYDNECDNNFTSDEKRGTAEGYSCTQCGGERFEVFTRFEYTPDLFDADFKEAAGRQQDFFTWFSLHGRCCKCGSCNDVADFECA
jgi:hypothetical protein